MLIYFGVYSILVLQAMTVPDRKANPFLLLSGFFLLWFMGTRYWVGCDFGGYLNRFDNTLIFRDFWETVLREEAGFQFLIASVKASGLGYMWLNVVASFILLLCILIFCRNHRSPLMILALMFPIMIIQLGMSGLRQALAMGFLLLASVQFMRGERIWTGAMILTGSLFHASAVIFLPMAFLAGRPVSTLRLIGALLVLSPAAAFLLADRFDVYTDRYIDQIYGDMVSGGARIRFILILVPAVLFLLYQKRMREKFPEVYDLLKLFTLITLSLIPVAILSSIALHRLNFYVMPISILTFVYLSLVIFPASQRTLARFLPAAAYGAYSLVWFSMSRHASSCYLPYQSYTFL